MTPSPTKRVWPPSLITIAALAAGLTGLVMAADARIQAAIVCVLLAALLDACDGRVARLTGTESRFGAELDSLSDAICFGAVPAFILYSWGLSAFGPWGWLPCLTLAVACVLRLARFNAALDEPAKPAWRASYFTGVPAPAGAFLAFFPVYISRAGLMEADAAARLALFWVPMIALLMVSRWPTFSGKSLGRKFTRLTMIPPALMGLAAAGGFYARPWLALTIFTMVYLMTLPLSAVRHAALAARTEESPEGSGRLDRPLA